jgi:predicted kinase
MSWQRKLFRTLANNNQVRFLILDCRAPKAVLRKWIKARLKTASDPSEADESVLRYQFNDEEPLTQAELAQVIRIRTDQTDYQTQLDQQLAEHL